MSTSCDPHAFDIPAQGQRCIWVFQVALSEEAVHALPDDEMAEVFGTWATFDRSFTECFDAETLNEFGLAKYISEANGMTVQDADIAKLNTQSGTIFLLLSDAFTGMSGQIAPELPFELIGRYEKPITLSSPVPLKSDSAKGDLPHGKAPMSDARISGMVATAVLVFLALFVVAFIWIAG